jgi:hypothetical protein
LPGPENVFWLHQPEFDAWFEAALSVAHLLPAMPVWQMTWLYTALQHGWKSWQKMNHFVSPLASLL